MSIHDKILCTWLNFWNVWLHECIYTLCGYRNVNHCYAFAAVHVDIERFFYNCTPLEINEWSSRGLVERWTDDIITSFLCEPTDPIYEIVYRNNRSPFTISCIFMTN